MSLELITAPASEPIEASDVWDHLRVTLEGSPAEPDDKGYIDALISAARHHLDGRDGWLGRALITQTWKLRRDDFPSNSDPIPLFLPPIQSVDEIEYVDTDGNTQTISSSDSDHGWRLNGDTHWRPRIDLKFNMTWPGVRDEPDAVRVTFTAGYGDNASDVPRAIPHAMLFLIGHWYANREEVAIVPSATQVPVAAEALLTPYRVWRF